MVFVTGHPQENCCTGTVTLRQFLFNPYSDETSVQAHGRFPELARCVSSSTVFYLHRNCSLETLYICKFQLIIIFHLLSVCHCNLRGTQKYLLFLNKYFLSKFLLELCQRIYRRGEEFETQITTEYPDL